MNHPRHTSVGRRDFLKASAWRIGAISLGTGSWLLPAPWANSAQPPIRVGIATDLTGALGSGGTAAVNTARLVARQINDAGGLLGRPLELRIEDTASNEVTGVNVSRKLVQREQVDVVIGGITSSMRNAIKDVIAARGKTILMYPSLYEGKECMNDLFCTGPTPAQQCDQLVPWLIKQGGKRFALTGSNYIWPRTLGAYVRESIQKQGGEVVYEEYFPLDQVEFGAAVGKIRNSRADTLFNMVIPPGVGPLFKQLHATGFQQGGGRLACVYFDENAFNFVDPREMQGLASSLDYFQSLSETDPASARILSRYNAMFPTTKSPFTSGNTATGVYRALTLYAAAVTEARTTSKADVARALDHARVAEGPGGPAEMVPGKRHVRMNMYIATVQGNALRVVDKSAGLVEPREC